MIKYHLMCFTENGGTKYYRVAVGRWSRKFLDESGREDISNYGVRFFERNLALTAIDLHFNRQLKSLEYEIIIKR